MLEEMMAHPVFLVVVITAVLSFFFSLLVCMSFSASSPVLFSSFTLFMAHCLLEGLFLLRNSQLSC